MPKTPRLRCAYDATVAPGKRAAKLIAALAAQFGADTITTYTMHRDGTIIEPAAPGRKQPKGHAVRIVVMVPE